VEVRLDAAALGRGSGRSKKEAEQAAARAALADPDALERALLDEPVTVAPADPRWPELAAEEIGRLKTALPEASIEHIGSTAVPGLEAKPIVDLMVGLPDVSPSLKLPDYESCGEGGVPGRLYFRKRGNAAAFNVHAVVKDGPLWRDALALRDYLRSRPDEAARYAEAKRAAIESGATTLQLYSRHKAPLILEFLERARESHP
jgi:GrpB-like predicted nucleotidyltransferase (UPF0157 family)